MSIRHISRPAFQSRNHRFKGKASEELEEICDFLNIKSGLPDLDKLVLAVNKVCKLLREVDGVLDYLVIEELSNSG